MTFTENDEVETLPIKKLAVSVKDATYITGLSRAMLYMLMRDGTLPSGKIGKRRFILVSDIEAFLERKIQQGYQASGI